MKTLIIPCAGRRIYDSLPLYLHIHPEGKMIVRKTLDGMPVNLFDRVIVTILRCDLQYDAAKLIEENTKDIKNVEICVLDEETSGAAETVYQTLLQKQVQGAVVVKDVTSQLELVSLDSENFIAGLNLSKFKGDVHSLRQKSFITLNEQGQVLDIIEKQIRSEIIGVGLYGFRDSNDFIFAYDRLKDEDYSIDKLYISHIISYLMGYRGYIFHYMETAYFEDWGSEIAWSEIQNRYATLFVDFDQLFGKSIDFSEQEKQLKDLKQLSKKGACLIGFTACTNVMANTWIQCFEKNNLHFSQIIYGCSFSRIKRIISSTTELHKNLYIR